MLLYNLLYNIYIILDILEEDTRKYCHIETESQYFLVSSENRKSNIIIII